MALFGNDPMDLKSILGRQADTQVAGIEDAYVGKKRHLAGALAHGGRYRSGVGNYDFGDLESSKTNDIGGVYGNLASTLAGIPAEDYLDQMGYSRSDSLARRIGDMNKPSSLQEILGLIGQGGNIAGKFAAFA